jgi:hypothetical protein
MVYIRVYITVIFVYGLLVVFSASVSVSVSYSYVYFYSCSYVYSYFSYSDSLYPRALESNRPRIGREEYPRGLLYIEDLGEEVDSYG